MNNNFYSRLLHIIIEDKEGFDTLVEADNVLGLNVTSEDIINFLEFASSSNTLNNPIIGNVIITEGDILSTLKIINDLQSHTGLYKIYINNDNLGINTYLISRANMIYQELGLDLKLEIDYSDNYNALLNELVTIVGSEEFILETNEDFPNANHIVV